MFGEVGSSRSARLPQAKPALLRRGLPRLYSTHVPSRICSNSLKTNDGRHVYPSQNRGDSVPAFGSLRGENPIPLFHPA
jgi:hypothetical protein